MWVLALVVLAWAVAFVLLLVQILPVPTPNKW